MTICCPPSEIAFSQVREDPNIEFQVVKQLTQTQSNRLRVLLIASGGCTALSLLAHPAIAQIDAIDLNPAQLHLVELRRQAILALSLEEQLQFIGGYEANDEAIKVKLYQRVRQQLPEATRDYWDGRQDEIAFGVNRVGKFEQLFRELAANFAAVGLDPIANPIEVTQNPLWHSLFERVFDRNKLAGIFGETAVNYSMDRSFGEHFADVFVRAFQRFCPECNYFLTQVWRDCYAEGVDGVPAYLQPSTQTAIKALGCDRIKLHQGAFAEKMPELAEDEKFDLIQFSNISDWMPLEDLDNMLKTAVTCLKPGGALVGRRLNGDRCLASIMERHLIVDRQLSDRLLQCDRSFFYREVVIGVHLMKAEGR